MTLLETGDSAERAYYTALFHRDFREAQRLYGIVSLTDAWTPDRMVREAHKCGKYDQADKEDAAPLKKASAPLSPRLDVAQQLHQPAS